MKNYLIYVDILGFNKLASIIAEKKEIRVGNIRKDFIEAIERKVDFLEEKNIILGKKYGGSDDWLLVTKELENVLISIYELLDHNTGHKDHPKVPLEIAIGTAEYDKWAKFHGRELITEDGTINFLKTDIVLKYRKRYEEIHEKKIHDTFIVFTESAYLDLELLDRQMCENQDDYFFVKYIKKIEERGKIFNFLREIEYQEHKWFSRVNEAYVPPLEYDDILNTLDLSGIVFITGTLEYGKTYTAIKVLWDYYNSGYKPLMIKGDSEDRTKVIETIENIRSILKPKHIIYFEDLFGKRKYDSRGNLEREIGTIIELIKQIDDIYVIITSREEIFKEFEKEKISEIELRDFKISLNIDKGSYDHAKRQLILINWAKEEGCSWLHDKYLKDLILDQIKDHNKLPTPMNLRDFAIASRETTDKDEFLKLITEKSKETWKSFAKEIKKMEKDKILFLCFPLISDFFDIHLVNRLYSDLLDELSIEDSWNFHRMLEWFEKDKITIMDGFIQFSHSSYAQTLEYILVEDGHLTYINEKIFSKVLIKLSKSTKTSKQVLYTIKDHYPIIPKDITREILLNLSDNKYILNDIIDVVSVNFDELPSDLRNSLLVKLSVHEHIAEEMMNIISNKFDELPSDLRNSLLVKLSVHEHIAEEMMNIISNKFDKLPESVQNLAIRFSKKNETSKIISSILLKNFKNMPPILRNNILTNLPKKVNAWNISWIIANYFHDIPEILRDNLLNEISMYYESIWGISHVLLNNFNHINPKIRNNLIDKISEKEEVFNDIIDVVSVNFDELPSDLRNSLLVKLSVHEHIAEEMFEIISSKFDMLSESWRNDYLLELYENKEFSLDVAWIVANNFDKVSDDLRLCLMDYPSMYDLC